jgi:hypothetical protein
MEAEFYKDYIIGVGWGHDFNMPQAIEIVSFF